MAIGALVFLFLVYGMNAICRQIFYYVLPSMVVEFKLTPEEAGVISAVVTMLVATVAIPAGQVVRPRWPRLGPQVPQRHRRRRILSVLRS